MKKFLVFATALGLAASGWAQTTQTAQAPLTSAPPTIDGILGTGEWNGTWYELQGASHPFEDSATTDETTMTAPDFAARWTAMHDATNIYIALEVDDDVRVPGDPDSWGGDCVEIFWDAQDTNVLDYAGQQSRIFWNGTEWATDAAATGAWEVNDTGSVWTLEVVFAKADGLDAAVADDQVVGFDIKVADNDTNGNNREVNRFWSSFQEDRENYNNALDWGDIELLALSADCLASGIVNENFNNTAIGATYSNRFFAEFDATVDAAPIDLAFGFADGDAAAYGDLAAIVRFNPDGFIDARNEPNYERLADISYVVGTNYHFRWDVNVAAKTYDVWVTPEGGAEVQIADDYAFRAQDSQINTYAFKTNSLQNGTLCNLVTMLPPAGITSNVYPPYIDEGTTVILTALAGTSYQWALDGTDIAGATGRELILDPITVADAGTYTVNIDGTIETLIISVNPEGSVPVAGGLGLAALMGASALAGAGILRRRRK